MVAYFTNWFSSAVILSLHSTSFYSLVPRTESLTSRTEYNFSVVSFSSVSLVISLSQMTAKWTNVMLNGCIVAKWM